MTLTIQLNLSPEIEEELRASIAHQDSDRLHQVLLKALAPTVEYMLQQSPAALSDLEFESIADQLTEALADTVGPDTPALSDQALSRAHIYADHP